jgi:cellobiose dehydrogenase (acceptor)
MARTIALLAAAASFLHSVQGQCTSAPSQTYDYIVIGSGAGGIPVADRLSEAGHSVLLLEKGPRSSGRWNGTMKPTWLEGTNLTRFDVPGLFNQIWHDSAGVACDDTGVMAGW